MPELRFARYRNEFRYTHYLFRFPAKFHAPAVRCLIGRYSNPGDVILDPFCGSGTLLVEALLSGRDSIGLDIDPVSAFIARVKCTPLSEVELRQAFDILRKKLRNLRRSHRDYDRLVHSDLSPYSISRFRDRLGIPNIPRIEHWFRTYVALDLAQIRKAILKTRFKPRVRNFFLACFASVIRNSSNADPVPVSGLEVTAHMKMRDAEGRRIDPFDLFETRVDRELAGMGQLWEQRKNVRARVKCGDATSLRRHLSEKTVDVVITSPPYNTAVDYYRRHTLEMYWLGFVNTREDRLKLAPKYVGRSEVRRTNRRLRCSFESGYINRLIAHAGRVGRAQQRAVTHYCASMRRALQHISRVLKPNGHAVLVVGNAKWNGRKVHASKLLTELAKNEFHVCDILSYTTRNRYMSYERHNGANVNREYALVLKKAKPHAEL